MFLEINWCDENLSPRLREVAPQGECERYFAAKGIGIVYLVAMEEFNDWWRADRFTDGPYSDVITAGGVYNPEAIAQGYGIVREGQIEVPVYTWVEESKRQAVNELLAQQNH